MPLSNFPKAGIRFEIELYQRPSDQKLLRNTHIAFSGTPQNHPTDPEKIILVVDPFSDNTFYYEFNTPDISIVEELANIVTLDGEVIPMVRIWVKKKSIAIRSTPFVVESTRR
jgi:hypothetical protein